MQLLKQTNYKVYGTIVKLCVWVGIRPAVETVAQWNKGPIVFFFVELGLKVNRRENNCACKRMCLHKRLTVGLRTKGYSSIT